MNSDLIVIDTDPYKNEKRNTEVKTFILVPETHPILKMKLKEFDFFNPSVDPNTFASSLVETCKKHKGLGLSANQCGYKHRVFVVGHEDNFVAFFNPKIVEQSKEFVKIKEGCLSFKDLFLSIERPQSIVVEYQDFTGQVHRKSFTGLTARCILHELDHLNGIVYTSRAKPMSLHMSMKKRKKNLLVEKKTHAK